MGQGSAGSTRGRIRRGWQGRRSRRGCSEAAYGAGGAAQRGTDGLLLFPDGALVEKDQVPGDSWVEGRSCPASDDLGRSLRFDESTELVWNPEKETRVISRVVEGLNEAEVVVQTVG